MHCAHFSFDLLGPHKGFLNLTECAHVHEFRKHLLTEFTVYLKSQNAHFLAPPIVLGVQEDGTGREKQAVREGTLYSVRFSVSFNVIQISLYVPGTAVYVIYMNT